MIRKPIRILNHNGISRVKIEESKKPEPIPIKIFDNIFTFLDPVKNFEINKYVNVKITLIIKKV